VLRGPDIKQSAMFSYLSPEHRVPADHPLRKIREITDQILKSLSGVFAHMYARVGRCSIPPEQLCRVLLQVLYTIRSKWMLMEQLEYNLVGASNKVLYHCCMQKRLAINHKQ
jgi:hypothetical protein